MRNTRLPTSVRIVEVGPRDGLQNESQFVPTETKTALINQLAAAGLRHIEAAAFVSPRWVPQMADGAQVLSQIERQEGVIYSALVPNERGLEAALEARVGEIAVFAAASNTFSLKNINCSIEESLARFKPVIEKALCAGVAVRGYISCALGCPFEGSIDPKFVATVASRLSHMGCHEISLGDTIGVGTPLKTQRLIDACTKLVPVTALAGHFHDTWGMAISNVYAALEAGITVFDSSVGGLGGCPYSPGATGNVATEDVVYLCEELGISTGIDLPALVAAADVACSVTKRPNESRVARAWRAQEMRRAIPASSPITGGAVPSQ